MEVLGLTVDRHADAALARRQPHRCRDNSKVDLGGRAGGMVEVLGLRLAVAPLALLGTEGSGGGGAKGGPITPLGSLGLTSHNQPCSRARPSKKRAETIMASSDSYTSYTQLTLAGRTGPDMAHHMRRDESAWAALCH